MAHGRGRFAKKIDTVHWTGIGAAWIGQTAGSTGRAGAAAQHLPETLLRFRGEWAASLAGGLASGVGISIAIGMIQVPEGTGTTVLWAPTTDADAPWIWWDTMALIYNEQVVDAVASNTRDGRRVVDSKAMRKLRNTELQFVVEQGTISGLSAGAADIFVDGRILAGS